MHGYSDHVNRYNDMFAFLAQRGIAVYGFDQRGWGRSVRKPSDKGRTGPTKRVLADLAAFIKLHVPKSSADPPLFVLGHSMGGQEVLMLMSTPAYVEDVVRPVRGWLLESPYIALPPEKTPTALKVFVGRSLGRLLPRQQMYNRIPPEDLSRDPDVLKSIAADTLMHNTGTLEGLAGMLDRTAALSSGAARPEGDAVRSLWVGHGTEDKAVSFEASKLYFERHLTAVPDSQFKAYEGWYHTLHTDGPCSVEYYQDVVDWILARSGPELQPESDPKRPEPKL